MKNIIIYTSLTWPHCHTAKKFLIDKGYKFIEKDVTNNPIYQKELAELGARGVPTFKINNEVIVGFNTEKIESLIDYKVTTCPNCSQRIRIPKNKGKIKITCKKCTTQFVIST
jgi:glutaredoxin